MSMDASPTPIQLFGEDPRTPVLDTGGPMALDTLTNLTANLGTAKDVRTQSTFGMHRIGLLEAENLYRSEWIAAQGVDTIAEDMTSRWRKFDGLDLKELQRLKKAEMRYRIPYRINSSIKWSRLHGGCGLVMGVDGAGEFHEELDLDRVKRGSLKWVQPIDRHHLIPMVTNNFHQLSEDFAEPSHYRAHAGVDAIHRSRIIFFHGVQAPYRQLLAEQFWGFSILERMRDAIVNATMTMNGVASLVIEAKVDVFKIQGLWNRLATTKGTQEIMQRVELANQAKSFSNAILMDLDTEDYEQKTSALSGRPDQIVEQMVKLCAAAADIPVARFLGTSATGLNATGEGDLANYYDAITARQENDLRPALDQLDEVFLRSELGQVPEDLTYDFPSLWKLSDMEQAEINLKEAQTAQVYVDMGAIFEENVTATLAEKGQYVGVDADMVVEIEKTMEIERKDEAELRENLLENPIGGDPDPDDTDPNAPDDEPDDGDD